MQNPIEINVCGKVMKVAAIDYDLCRSCKNGVEENRMHESGKPDRIAALCNRTCMCHLDEQQRTSNKFENPFRTRDTWSIGKDRK